MCVSKEDMCASKAGGGGRWATSKGGGGGSLLCRLWLWAGSGSGGYLPTKGGGGVGVDMSESAGMSRRPGPGRCKQLRDMTGKHDTQRVGGS